MLRILCLSLAIFAPLMNSSLNAQLLLNPLTQDNNILKVKFDNIIDSRNYYQNLSEIAIGVEYVALETSPQCLLGHRLKVRIIKNGILINDSQKRFHMFNLSGKHLWSIDNQGRGPGEYPLLTTFFDVNEERQEIYMPTSSKLIMVYGFSGELKKTINAPVQVSDIVALSTGNFIVGHYTLALDGTVYRLIDSNGRLLNKIDKNSSEVEAGTVILGPQRYNDGVIFTLRDTVWYSRDGYKLLPIIEIDRRIRGNSESKYVAMLSSFGNSTLGITIVDPLMYSTFDYTSNKFTKIGNSGGEIIDDFDSFQEINLNFHHDGYASEIIYPQDLERMTRIKTKSKLDMIKKNIKLEDNPVIMIVKLKDFF